MFRKTVQPKPSNDDAVITETAPCQKALRIRVKPAAIAPVRAEVFGEFQRQATLPGFRKGKAPVELVERQFAKSIHDETLHRVTKQTFEQVAKDHHLKPVGPFEVSAADFTDDNGLTLQATVEVEPSFALGTYKGISLTSQPVDVSAQDMEQALVKLQESMSQLEPVGEGETKERRVPARDDELAKDLGFKDLTTLQEHVRAKLLEQKRAAQQQVQEAALCDELLTRHAFNVPPRLVSRQTERLTRDFQVRLLLSGIAEEKLSAETAKFTEQLRTSAERQVKLGFICERIADAESVTVTQDEIVGRLWELSQRWKKDPAEGRKTLDTQHLWPSIISTIRQEKTMALLCSSARIDGSAGPPAAPAARQTAGSGISS